MTLTKIRTKKL